MSEQQTGRDAEQGAEDERLAVYEREREELAAAIIKAVNGQYIGKPPPLLTGWQERAVSAVLAAGWLPPAAVQERVDATPRQGVTHEQVEQAALFMFAVRTYSHRRPDYARKCWGLVIDEDDREAWRRTARDLLAFAGIPVEGGEQHG